jgi:hypothetical protein
MALLVAPVTTLSCSGQPNRASADGGDRAEGGADKAEGGADDGSFDAAREASSPPTLDCGPDPWINAGVSAASGTVSGPNVSASFCNVNAYVYDSALFVMGGLPPPSIVATNPPDTTDPDVRGELHVGLAPGVYPSAGACGYLIYEFGLPVSPGVTCSENACTPPGCARQPTGDGGLGPCQPVLRDVQYVAQGENDCRGDQGAIEGSWTVTLTSVEPYGDAGNSVAHGTLTATLLDSQDGGDTATLTLGF